jgi:hypothetical protein
VLDHLVPGHQLVREPLLRLREVPLQEPLRLRGEFVEKIDFVQLLPPAADAGFVASVQSTYR